MESATLAPPASPPEASRRVLCSLGVINPCPPFFPLIQSCLHPETGIRSKRSPARKSLITTLPRVIPFPHSLLASTDLFPRNRLLHRNLSRKLAFSWQQPAPPLDPPDARPIGRSAKVLAAQNRRALSRPPLLYCPRDLCSFSVFRPHRTICLCSIPPRNE